MLRLMSDASQEHGNTDPQSSEASEQSAPSAVVEADAPPARPRLWPTALAIPLAPVLSVIVALICVKLAIDLPDDEEARQTAIEEFSLTRLGSVVTIAPGLLTLLAVALVAAAMSPTGISTCPSQGSAA